VVAQEDKFSRRADMKGIKEVDRKTEVWGNEEIVAERVELLEEEREISSEKPAEYDSSENDSENSGATFYFDFIG